MEAPWVEVTLHRDSYCRLCGKKLHKGEDCRTRLDVT